MKIVVIGGLSAGPSAAAKARRENENAEIILFEKTDNISYATCGIPYALSGVIKEREDLLVVEANLLRTRFNIDVHLGEAVTEILPEEQKVKTPLGEYEYDSLVFATGAATVIPPITNIDKAENWSACRTLADYDKIMKTALASDAKHVTVMGAGLIGVEVAENLKEAGKSVTIIEGSSQVLPMWEGKFSQFAKNTLQEHGIEVITDTFINEFNVEGNQIKSLPLKDGATLNTDFVIMSVGIRPNTQLLTSKGADHIGNGALKVNERMETNLPNIYAAGDCASVKNIQTGEYDYFPLGTHSNKAGRAAGTNAAGGNETFLGAYKTAIIKVFDKTLARTGMNPVSLEKAGIDYETNLIIAGATPGYYPGQTDLIVEIYYKPEDGTILGAEVFGPKGADKRIDVLATAIYAKLKISDLPNLDLAYAPPYSPAKDPVVVTGFVSKNANGTGYSEIDANALRKVLDETKIADINLVDVRTPVEIKRLGGIEGAINVPLDTIRENLNSLDKSKPTYIYCAKGLRGYLASRILIQNGFDSVINLSGGYTIWDMSKES